VMRKRLTNISIVLFIGLLSVGSAIKVLANGSIRVSESNSTDLGQESVVSNTLYLPLIYIPHPAPLPTPLDLTLFLIGDGRLYEVRHQDGSQERIQAQIDSGRFFHVKGENNGKWEELWATDEFIYRGTDTSPADDGTTPQYYTLRENGQYGSPWAPRYWRVGQIFERNPIVSFYDKEDCVYDEGGLQTSWLKFVAYYPTYNFPGPIPGGITLTNVIQLAWLTPESQPVENYFYAQYYGLVGWSNDEGKEAFISEIQTPEKPRPEMIREEIPCLDTTGQPDQMTVGVPIGILPPPNRAK
jgi:hypothetical protein